MNNKKLKGKDVITIGIFTAIYFAINFGFMLLGGLHPLMWILMPGFIALVGSIPYMIMVQKVKNRSSHNNGSYCCYNILFNWSV